MNNRKPNNNPQTEFRQQRNNRPNRPFQPDHKTSPTSGETRPFQNRPFNKQQDKTFVKQTNMRPYNNQTKDSTKFNDKQNHDKDNDSLEDIEIKRQILEYMYSTIQLSDYKYKLIEYEYDMTLLKEKSYFVSPNYNGIHSLLIFIKIKDKFLSFIVDRKTLTYSIKQIDYSKVKMIPVFFNLDKEIYDGTIFDGVFLYNNINRLKHFVINDVYYFRGKSLANDKITNKILNIGSYLETIKNDSVTNNIVFIVNKLYPLNEIQQLVNMYIPKSKYSKSIKGIAFYSEYSGTKLIYLYNNCSHENKEEPAIPKDSPKMVSGNSGTSTVATTAVFKMKKTEIVDVYHLFLGQKTTDGSKKLFKYKKIGIALVNTAENSAFCNESFIKANTDELLMECKLDMDKNKWIPFKVNTDKKRPDLIDVIGKVGE
jgi:hypothetical protein